MPEIAADEPALSCYLLLFGAGIEEHQQVSPDLFLQKQARTRDVGRKSVSAFRQDPKLAIGGLPPASPGVIRPKDSGAAGLVVEAKHVVQSRSGR